MFRFSIEYYPRASSVFANIILQYLPKELLRISLVLGILFLNDSQVWISYHFLFVVYCIDAGSEWEGSSNIAYRIHGEKHREVYERALDTSS